MNPLGIKEESAGYLPNLGEKAQTWMWGEKKSQTEFHKTKYIKPLCSKSLSWNLLEIDINKSQVPIPKYLKIKRRRENNNPQADL